MRWGSEKSGGLPVFSNCFLTAVCCISSIGTWTAWQYRGGYRAPKKVSGVWKKHYSNLGIGSGYDILLLVLKANCMSWLMYCINLCMVYACVSECVICFSAVPTPLMILWNEPSILVYSFFTGCTVQGSVRGERGRVMWRFWHAFLFCG